MSQSHGLPVELHSGILKQIVTPHHLAPCCLVNKRFSYLAIPLLYETIYMYNWDKHVKAKIKQLFTTLSKNPELARWVKKLELRDFPQGYDSRHHESLVKICLRGLSNCTSLRSFTWTLKTELRTEIFDVLSLRCPQLRELDINGNATGKYDPSSLLQFNTLSMISLRTLSKDLLAILPQWLEKTGETLVAFHLLGTFCSYAYPLFTDKTLEALAPSLTRLKHFHIAGCGKVTDEGLCAILAHNASKLESLLLDVPSSDINLENLGRRIPPLTSMSSITLTVHECFPNDAWEPGFLALTNRSPLTAVGLYGWSLLDVRTTLTAGFVESVLAHHAPRLRNFSVDKLGLPPGAVSTICTSCSNLESLSVVINDDELDEVVSELARSRSLRNIHIKFFSHFSHLQPTECLSIARKLGPGIRQLAFGRENCYPTFLNPGGCAYLINRVARRNDRGEIIIDLELESCHHPGVMDKLMEDI